MHLTVELSLRKTIAPFNPIKCTKKKEEKKQLTIVMNGINWTAAVSHHVCFFFAIWERKLVWQKIMCTFYHTQTHRHFDVLTGFAISTTSFRTSTGVSNHTIPLIAKQIYIYWLRCHVVGMRSLLFCIVYLITAGWFLVFHTTRLLIWRALEHLNIHPIHIPKWCSKHQIIWQCF